MLPDMELYNVRELDLVIAKTYHLLFEKLGQKQNMNLIKKSCAKKILVGLLNVQKNRHKCWLVRKLFKKFQKILNFQNTSLECLSPETQLHLSCLNPQPLLTLLSPPKPSPLPHKTSCPKKPTLNHNK
jgi:hypothetical protein